jgi:hypothetical protein
VETLDSKVEVEGPSKSPRESPPPSQDARRPFKIKRRMEKMEMEKEAQHLKAAKVRSTCEVFIMIKMLDASETTCRAPDGNKEEYPRQLQGPKAAKATQTHSGEMKDHTRDHEDHDRRTGVRDAEPQGRCCIRQDQRTKPACEDKKMSKPKWVPKIATPAKSVDPK